MKLVEFEGKHYLLDDKKIMESLWIPKAEPLFDNDIDFKWSMRYSFGVVTPKAIIPMAVTDDGIRHTIIQMLYPKGKLTIHNKIKAFIFGEISLFKWRWYN